MATSSATRSKSRHSVFGYPKELAKNVLPTCEGVFKAYCHYQQNNACNSVYDIAKNIAAEVTEIYANASIPTIAFHIEKGNDLRKYPESKRSSTSYQESLSCFSKLFDICSCKCVDGGIRERKDCTCPLECKIPRIEWDFWIDQKTTRKMVIGKIDPFVTSKLQKLEERKWKAEKFARKEMAECSSASKEMEYSSEEDTDISNSYVEYRDEHLSDRHRQRHR